VLERHAKDEEEFLEEQELLLEYFAYKHEEDRERTEIAAAADIVVIPGEDEWKMYELSFWCLIICKFIYI
jgi:hypothetical protein